MLRFMLCSVLVACVSGQDWEIPDYCRGLDCPVFELLQQTEEYEQRRYFAQQWVSTDFTAASIEESDEESGRAFNRLFNYIAGGNDANVVINMTAPVLQEGRSNATEGRAQFTQSFYIPYAYQDAAPQPTGDGVYLQTYPQLTVYVRAFSDYAYSEQYLEEAAKLSASLEADNAVYSEEVQYWGGYDSPFQPFNRHNEVWLEAA